MDHRYRKVLIRLVLSGSSNCLFYTLFFFIQENAYGRYNILKPVNDLVFSQVSATSLLGGLAFFGLPLLVLFQIGAQVFPQRYLLISKFAYVWLILTGCLYSFAEYQQSLDPPYHDMHLFDAICGWVACGIIALIIRGVR